MNRVSRAMESAGGQRTVCFSLSIFPVHASTCLWLTEAHDVAMQFASRTSPSMPEHQKKGPRHLVITDVAFTQEPGWWQTRLCVQPSKLLHQWTRGFWNSAAVAKLDSRILSSLTREFYLTFICVYLVEPRAAQWLLQSAYQGRRGNRKRIVLGIILRGETPPLAECSSIRSVCTVSALRICRAIHVPNAVAPAA